MNDRPNAIELVAAVREYLEGELLPTITDARLRFQTLVAVNALAIAGRELASEEHQLLEEGVWLAALLHSAEPMPQRLAELKQAVRRANEQLCERIRRGEYDDEVSFQDLLEQLSTTVTRKLAVANPKYLDNFYHPASDR
jgi:hypothetical protein